MESEPLLSDIEEEQLRALRNAVVVNKGFEQFESRFNIPHKRKKSEPHNYGEGGKEQEKNSFGVLDRKRLRCNNNNDDDITEEGDKEIDEELGFFSCTEDEKEEEETDAVSNNKDDDDDDKDKDTTTNNDMACDDETKATERVRGTLRDVQKYWDRGLLREGQYCSMQRRVIGRSSAIQYYTLVFKEGKLIIEPISSSSSSEGNSPTNSQQQPPPPLSGRTLIRKYNHMIKDTNLYSQTREKRARTLPYVDSFYDVIRFHFTLRTDPSLVIAVPAINLELLESFKDEWVPVVYNPITTIQPSSPATATSACVVSENAITPIGNGNFSHTESFCMSWIEYKNGKAYRMKQVHPSKPDACICLDEDVEYGIGLENHMPQTHVLATVYIGGRFQGEFLLRPKQRFVLNRPINAKRQFMFVSHGMKNASSIIHVRFTPDKQPQNTVIQWTREDTFVRDAAAPAVSAEDHTFLSSSSSPQSFSTKLFSFDEAASVTLSLKLKSRSQSNLLPLSDCRGL